VICSMGVWRRAAVITFPRRAGDCRERPDITGSIGVIMHGINYRGLIGQVGIAPMTFKSGKYKDMLSPTQHKRHSAEEHAMVQARLTRRSRNSRVSSHGRAAAREKQG